MSTEVGVCGIYTLSQTLSHVITAPSPIGWSRMTSYKVCRQMDILAVTCLRIFSLIDDVSMHVVNSGSSDCSSWRLSEADVRRLIMSSAIKSSTLDPVPTFLSREFVDVLLPYVACTVNSSLLQGRLPDSQKHAVVTPLLKRPGLDTADMANYRPVSNVTFMSKIVERAVSHQLHQ